MLAGYHSSHQSQSPSHPPTTPSNPLLERLDKFVTLNAEECEALVSLCGTRRTFRANETLVHEGGRPDRVCLILSGVAFRYRYLANGRRQIFGYLLPGDLCDTQFVILNESDHNVGLLCSTEVATIPLSALMSTMVKYPRIERALLMMSLVDAAILREWLLNLGQRDACQKLAHFFCELNARYHPFQLQQETRGFKIPLTQIELADTMGLTVVHVNRILQRFRREGLLRWSRHHVDILDYAQLEHIAGFDESYLRLQPMRAEPTLCAYG